MTNFKYHDAVVIVLAKAPIPGEVNTRLIPDIGVEEATKLQTELIDLRLKNIKQNKLCKVELWCSPDSKQAYFHECKNNYNVVLFDQQGDDLGERMSFAIKEALQRFTRVILIGTDAPSLSLDMIEMAIIKLDEKIDVVIAPAEDGGYVLIGMSKRCDDVFYSVPWGTDKVLSCTRKNIKANSLVSAELELCWDIDRAEDYQRYKTGAHLNG